jgi:response regulator RpfG family c-di-GMP phosphodiesterase
MLQSVDPAGRVVGISPAVEAIRSRGPSGGRVIRSPGKCHNADNMRHVSSAVHDIGKIGVPDAVLLKPGPLTEAEWEIMRRHVEIGALICAPLRSLRPVLPIIRHHHERYDGSGYPDGLAGEKIPYVARVFQVVDVFHALTSDRHYRKAFSTERAIAILTDETDRGFWDPRIVDVFVRGMLAEPSVVSR